VSAWSDRRLATLVGVVLLAGVAWPLAFVAVPPYQDLPGHLATVSVLQHLGSYPEYAATGPWKTNAAFTSFCLVAGRAVGLVAAAKLFVLIVLAAGAFVLPRFVLHFGGRRRMLVSSLAAWPMVHNWFVATGMLDFALAIPASLVLLVLLDRNRASPSPARAVAAGTMAVATWYAHAFPVLVVGLMVLAHVVSRARRPEVWRQARVLLMPLVPVGLLLAWSVALHVTTAGAPVAGSTERTEYSSLAWQVYDLWAHWLYGFTPLSASTLVAAGVLVAWTVRRWRRAPVLLGPWPTLAVLAAYLACPSVAFDWGYAGSRFVPFLWIAALVRAPARLPRAVVAALGLSAVAYWVGNGIDMLRLDSEMRELAAGVDAVPDGARVAFLVFSTRLTSRNTWSLATAVGLYAVERHTNAPNLWANNASQALVRTRPPERWEDSVAQRRFLDTARDRRTFCQARASLGLDPALCEAAWKNEWAATWADIHPHATHVLMWDPSDDARAELPPGHTLVFHQGRLWIWSAPSGKEP
jgi:hypothetical protein